MLKEDSKKERRIVWLIVAKAAVRSRKIRILKWPESEERSRSLLTLIRVDFVLYRKWKLV